MEQALPQETATWAPRWYYIMRNRTSGKLYACQTTAKNMDRYCGSGEYWMGHCTKHGGHNRDNIEVVEQTWCTEKTDAQAWLDRLEASVPDYWNDNPKWANRVLENTEDNPFAGEAGRALARKRIAEGTHHLAGEAGSELNRKTALKRIAEGTHPLAGQAGSAFQRKRVAEGTHPLAGQAGSALQRKIIAEGRHPFAGEAGSKNNLKRVAEGTHPAQQMSRFKAFYEAATGKSVRYHGIHIGCPEEIELQALGYDTHAIRYGSLKWPEAA